jgi:pimeloyl-ACP methyl ester carboxylesterase
MRFAPLLRLLGVGVLRRKIRRELIAASGDPRWVTEEVVLAYTEPAARDLGATLKAFRAMAHAREAEPLAPRLHEIAAPVALLIGTAPHDASVQPAEIESMRRALHSFTVETVAEAGHYLQEERPDAVAAAVRQLRSRVAAMAATADP